jgi:toxin ParE1/3/4
MTHSVRLTEKAEADLQGMFVFISAHASAAVARGYINRLLKYLEGFSTFPERGSLRPDIRPGLRIIGFERRISVAFVVEENEVVILRLLYAGRQFDVP